MATPDSDLYGTTIGGPIPRRRTAPTSRGQRYQAADRATGDKYGAQMASPGELDVFNMPASGGGLTPDEIAQLSGMLPSSAYKRGHMHAEFNGQTFDQEGAPRARIDYNDAARWLAEADKEKNRTLALQNQDKDRAFQLQMAQSSPQAKLAEAEIARANASTDIAKEQNTRLGLREDIQTADEKAKKDRAQALREQITSGNVPGFLPSESTAAGAYTGVYDDPGQALNAGRQDVAQQAMALRQAIDKLEANPTPRNLQQAASLRQQYQQFSRFALNAAPTPAPVAQALNSDPAASAAFAALKKRVTDYGTEDASPWHIPFLGPGQSDRDQILKEAGDLSGLKSFSDAGYDPNAVLEEINRQLRGALSGYAGHNENDALLQALSTPAAAAAPAPAGRSLAALGRLPR